MDTSINYWAVLVSAIVSMVIGSIWYGPLFGKQFMQAMGMDKWSPEEKAKMQKSMIGSYVAQFVGSAVMFFVTAWYIITSIHPGVWGGVANAFGLWLGFCGTAQLEQRALGRKNELVLDEYRLYVSNPARRRSDHRSLAIKIF